MSKRSDNAMGLYLEGIRDGKPQQAQDKYTGRRYTQHSTGVGDGSQGFVDFFLPFIQRNPKRDIHVLRMIEDGPYVFCHVYQSLNDGEAQWITMDMFDTDSEGRIIEHWDVIAPYISDTASGEDMTAGPEQPTQLDKTDLNKSIVKEYTKLVLTMGQVDLIDEFVAPNLIQHAADLPNGRDALADALNSGQAGRCEMMFKLIGQGDLVATLSKTIRQDKAHATFDLYRLENGMITEHWETSEEILPREEWTNSGKF